MPNRSRRIKTLASMLALAGVVGVLTAMPAAGGGVVAEPPLAVSSNVHLLAHILGTAAGMNFKDHYAYVSGWGGITVLDIANAASPQIAGALPLPHFENEDVDLCGDILLVVNDREAKDLGSIMYVISLANPTVPTVRSSHSASPAAAAGRATSRTSSSPTARRPGSTAATSWRSST